MKKFTLRHKMNKNKRTIEKLKIATIKQGFFQASIIFVTCLRKSVTNTSIIDGSGRFDSSVAGLRKRFFILPKNDISEANVVMECPCKCGTIRRTWEKGENKPVHESTARDKRRNKDEGHGHGSIRAKVDQQSGRQGDVHITAPKRARWLPVGTNVTQRPSERHPSRASPLSSCRRARY